MRKIFISGLIIFMALSAWSQSKPVRILFDVTSNDTLIHKVALRHATLMAKAYPDSKFEVVVYAGALPMFLKDKSVVAKQIKGLENSKNIAFVVCGETMKRNNVDKSQLLPGIVIVPDAIIEIATKQAEGWGYIKEAY